MTCPRSKSAQEAEQMKTQVSEGLPSSPPAPSRFLCVPSWCSGRTTKAHPTVPTNVSCLNFCLFLPLSPALASLLQIARTTEYSISTRPGPPQPAPRGQRRPGQQKSVLLLLVKETQGVCFPLPWVTKSSQSAVTPAP